MEGIRHIFIIHGGKAGQRNFTGFGILRYRSQVYGDGNIIVADFLAQKPVYGEGDLVSLNILIAHLGYGDKEGDGACCRFTGGSRSLLLHSIHLFYLFIWITQKGAVRSVFFSGFFPFFPIRVSAHISEHLFIQKSLSQFFLKFFPEVPADSRFCFFGRVIEMTVEV